MIGAPESNECAMALATVLKVFERLGLPVAPNRRRVHGPALLSWASSWIPGENNSSPSPEVVRAAGAVTGLERP